ncbi:MAG: AhpC/TSA family protein [Planctomycetes bacterium]|nr:AhpC/TSA family protein [Planctomycetota bacterium]
MSLARDLRQVRASLEAQLSAGVLEAAESALRETCAGGSAARVLDVGECAPEFELTTPSGGTLRCSELLADGPLLVCFIRGAWCPFSATELQYLGRYAPQVRETGASILALSPEPAERCAEFATSLGLDFPLLQDADSRVARGFGLEIEFDDPLRAVLRAERIAYGGRREVPVPGLFVLDPAGVVRFAYSRTDYHLRAEPESWMRVLRKI